SRDPRRHAQLARYRRLDVERNDPSAVVPHERDLIAALDDLHVVVVAELRNDRNAYGAEAALAFTEVSVAVFLPASERGGEQVVERLRRAAPGALERRENFFDAGRTRHAFDQWRQPPVLRIGDERRP